MLAKEARFKFSLEEKQEAAQKYSGELAKKNITQLHSELNRLSALFASLELTEIKKRQQEQLQKLKQKNKPFHTDLTVQISSLKTGLSIVSYLDVLKKNNKDCQSMYDEFLINLATLSVEALQWLQQLHDVQARIDYYYASRRQTI